MCLGMGEQQGMFLKSKGFLRDKGHWKRHGFETFSGFEKLEKRDNIARWSARNGRATKVIFFKICAHYGKNATLRARRGIEPFLMSPFIRRIGVDTRLCEARALSSIVFCIDRGRGPIQLAEFRVHAGWGPPSLGRFRNRPVGQGSLEHFQACGGS